MDHSKNNTLLATRYREGDLGALDELICSNMGIVKSIAIRYINRGTDLEDLIQIGSVGLIKAARSYDPELGFEFSTYAYSMINGELRRHFRDDGIIKVSRSIKKYCAALLHEKELYEKKYNCEPTLSYLAEKCNISKEDAVLCLGASYPVGSLNNSSDDEASPQDRIGTDNIGAFIEKYSLYQAICELDDEERLILHLRYTLSCTQAETAERLGTNQVKISRMEKKILEKLRQKLK